MPEGPFGFPRPTTLAPMSDLTRSEIEENWNDCPDEEKHREVCEQVKRFTFIALESKSAFPAFNTLEEINSGKCHDVARQVAQTVPHVDYVRLIGGAHGWVRYDGWNYDPEVPSGVPDIQGLPFFSRKDNPTLLSMAQRRAQEQNLPEPATLDEAVVVRERRG